MLHLGDTRRRSVPNGLLVCAALLCLFYPKQPFAQFFPNFDVQARGGSTYGGATRSGTTRDGASGLFPDHSIEAFMAALDLRVTTLYIGVAVTADKQVVASRSLTVDPDVCSGSRQNIPIYQISYGELKLFDCGKKSQNAFFPQQQTIPMAKPLLAEVIIASEDHIKNWSHYAVDYCFEMDCSPASDGRKHPEPEEYSNIVYDLVQQYLPLERVVIASSDMRLLRYWHKTFPTVRLAFLANNKKTLQQNCTDLGFFPSAYCPTYDAMKIEDISAALKFKVRFIPASVNQSKQMLALKGEKASGIITDRADLAGHYKATLAMPVK